MKKIFLLSAAIFCFVIPFYSQSKKIDLSITAQDMYMLPENGGFHLYIRKKTDIESVMLVESNKDPAGKQTNYAYRAKEYNPVNGDEIRYLDGKVLDSKYAKYSLIDSTPEENEKFGKCFHIYVPEVIVYGYPWARSGEINVADGFFVNIRAFSKKYCDYTGQFSDNSFNLKVQEKNISKSDKKVELRTERSDLQSMTEIEKVTGSVVEETALNEKIELVEEVDLTEELEDELEIPAVEQEELLSESSEENNEIYEDSLIDDGIDVEIPAPFIEEESELEEETDAGDGEEDFVEAETEEETADNKDLPETDETDVVAKVPFNEATAVYTPTNIEKTKRVFDDWEEKTQMTVPDSPFEEPYEPGLKEDPVAKFNRLLAEEELKKARLLQGDEETEGERVYEYADSEEDAIPDSFDIYDIHMQLVRGDKKISSLYISSTEVTQKSFSKIMGYNPSTVENMNNPVETVSWYDVLVFCNRLSIKNKLTPCYSINGETNPSLWGATPEENNDDWNNIECDYEANGYRMLTLAEWEFAANGGVFKEKGSFAGNKRIEPVAWFSGNSENTPHEAGLKSQNPCQLYDMCGNVSEYCMGKTGNKKRVAALRGGNYSSSEKSCKTKNVEYCEPWKRQSESGIRICCLAE